MDSLEDSFQLLSSMSPRLTKTKKIKPQKVTKLALKTNFRRSSIYDKAPQSNANVLNIESSSSETISSSDDNIKVKEVTCKNTPTSIKKDRSIILIESTDESSHEEENIVVPDSDVEENIIVKSDDNKFKKPPVDSVANERHIFKAPPAVLKWVEQIDKQSNMPNMTVNNISIFSEVSTIFGENKIELNNDLLVLPSINSTFVPDKNCFRFDEMFKKEEQVLQKKFESPKKDNVNKLVDEVAGNSDVDDNLILEDSFDRLLAKPSKIPATPLQEQEDLLDELYGNSWRKMQEKVLPKTEEKKSKKKNSMQRTTKTEVKPKKESVIKNPYLEVNSGKSTLLRTMQSARLRLNIESPWTEKLKQLCDPESSSEPNSDIENIKPNQNFKKKLSFDDSDDDDYDPNFNDVPKQKTTVKKNEDYKKKSYGISKKDDIKNAINNEKTGKSVQKNRESKEKAKKKFVVSSDSDLDSLLDVDYGWRDNKKSMKAQKESKPLGFLASLGANVPIAECDPAARMFREDYKQRKEELAKRLYAMFNKNIFENKLPDDMEIEWSDRMLRTAGYCYCKKMTRRTGAVERSARIKLGTKVLDSADRLRNTLVHEMCHAAAWIIDEVKDGHGPYWQAWTRKAMKVYPELPPIRRCHDYDIQTKYTYRCIDCSYSFGRHSKSVDIEKKCCGYCKGRFEILINKTTKDGVKAVPATPRKAPTAFANFVKENYKLVKTDDLKHGDVMKMLSAQFKELKVLNT